MNIKSISFKKYFELMETHLNCLKQNNLKVYQNLTEGPKKTKPKKPKQRPKKNLWFTDRHLWLNDINFSKGGKFNLFQTEDDTIYATDKDQQICYGVWHGKRNMGIAFYESRPINAVKHPRIRIKPIDQTLKLTAQTPKPTTQTPKVPKFPNEAFL